MEEDESRWKEEQGRGDEKEEEDKEEEEEVVRKYLVDSSVWCCYQLCSGSLQEHLSCL